MVNLVVQNFLENKNLYNKIYNDLRKNLDESIPINHVGSTAIPDMCGKNIIDILVGANDQKEFALYREIIANMGFYASNNSKTEIYQFFASKQGETGVGDIHIHLGIIGTERYEEFLILRDYLLKNRSEVEDYIKCKKQLIEIGITERKQYKALNILPLLYIKYLLSIYQEIPIIFLKLRNIQSNNLNLGIDNK